jgi:DNA-binding IclR family transcriptional regulator
MESIEVGTRGLRSVDRALDLLEFVAHGNDPVGLAELTDQLGLSKSTAHRILVTLRRRGFVHQLPGGRTYAIGVKSFEVGAAFLAGTSLPSASLVEMERLATLTQETVNLAILDGRDIVYVEKLNSSRAYSVTTRVGSRSPAHCTALGKAILAVLDSSAVDKLLDLPLERYTPRTICDAALLRAELGRIRSESIAIDREEIEPNMCCVAAAIFDYRGHVIAAIGVAGPTRRLLHHLQECAEHVRDAARRISSSLVYLVPEP